VKIAFDSQHISLVYGMNPVIGNVTVDPSINTFSFNGGLITMSGLLTVVSLDVGMEVISNGGNLLYVYFLFSWCVLVVTIIYSLLNI